MRTCPECYRDTTKRICPDCEVPTRDSDIFDFFQRKNRGATLLHVVGVSEYQPALRALRETYGRDVTVQLEGEPTNPHDSNAVRVTHIAETRDTLGYLKRGHAKRYRVAVEQFGPKPLDAVIVGGGRDKPTLGLYVDFTPVRALYDSDPKRRAKRKTETGTIEPAAPPRGCVVAKGCAVILAAVVGVIMLIALLLT